VSSGRLDVSSAMSGVIALRFPSELDDGSDSKGSVVGWLRRTRLGAGLLEG
jgi:hypothetical protein